MRDGKHGLRTLGIAILVSLGLMAFLTAGAHGQGTAGNYLINGVSPGDNLNATFTANQEGLWGQLLVPTRGNIKCKGFTITTGIIDTSTDASVGVGFEECEVFGHPGDVALPVCTVHSTGVGNGFIVASALLLPRLHNAGRYVLAEPQVGTGHFTQIEILGATCALRGTYLVDGAVVGEVTAGNNTATPLLTFSQIIQLLVGDLLLFKKLPAYVNGAAEARLTGAPNAHAGLSLGVD